MIKIGIITVGIGSPYMAQVQVGADPQRLVKLGPRRIHISQGRPAANMTCVIGQPGEIDTACSKACWASS
ncbi:MAG: hypothetical protein ABGW82_13900 [Paracoccus sp. (in: a-proteobacteria)]